MLLITRGPVFRPIWYMSLFDAYQIFKVLLILQLESMIDILKHPWLIDLNLILLLVRQ